MAVAEQSTFRGIIEFFARLGIYDVVLPFLLVFTIVFAILEKTKVFGTETIGGQSYTRKNLNAMTAFVIAFLVVASARLVAAINESLANVVLLMIFALSFMLLIGVFYHYDEKVFLEGGWRKLFMVLMFVGIVLIFSQSVKTDSGEGFLTVAWNWISINFALGSVVIDSLIFLVIIIGFMYFITKDNKSGGGDHGSTGSGGHH